MYHMMVTVCVSAIAYQLTSIGVCDVDSNGLRQTMADFLKANKNQ